jgi:hypothetical protein
MVEGYILVDSGEDSATQSCPTGKQPIAGGYSIAPDPNLRVTGSYPSTDGYGWTVETYKSTTGQASVRVYAICAVVGT